MSVAGHSPGREADVVWLERAVELASRGLNTTSPNPRVGCVIVRDGKLLGEGWHQWAGQGHAEVNAITAAGGDVRGATVYVSLEPCNFAGRTPACSGRLIAEGVARVVVAEVDPHPRVSGQGLSALQAAGIATEVIELSQARALNPGFRRRFETGRPLIRIKIAASLDGRTAMASGESQWITGPEARADVQALRARSCAILTGSGTILADNPSLTVREASFAVDGRIRQPLIVVADSALRSPSSAKIFQSAGGVLLATTSPTPIAGVEAQYLVGEAGADGRVDLANLAQHLTRLEINELLVEAGPTLVGTLLRQSLWDEIVLYQAARFLGRDARPLADLTFQSLSATIGVKIVDHVLVGDDIRLTIHPR